MSNLPDIMHDLAARVSEVGTEVDQKIDATLKPIGEIEVEVDGLLDNIDEVRRVLVEKKERIERGKKGFMPQKKRGRKPGSRNKAAQQEETVPA